MISEKGKVGQSAVGEVEAVAGDHLPPGLVRPVAELGEEPGLADAGVTGEEDGRAVGRDSAVSGRRDAERGAEVLQLGFSSTSGAVMWSILSRTTDSDISVDPVLRVGGGVGAVPLERRRHLR